MRSANTKKYTKSQLVRNSGTFKWTSLCAPLIRPCGIAHMGPDKRQLKRKGKLLARSFLHFPVLTPAFKCALKATTNIQKETSLPPSPLTGMLAEF